MKITELLEEFHDLKERAVRKALERAREKGLVVRVKGLRGQYYQRRGRSERFASGTDRPSNTKINIKWESGARPRQ